MNEQGIIDLQRFEEAQELDYEQALKEIRQGRKMSHWIWYIFPQIQGLGHSIMAERYAINSLEEAGAYINHPVLGARLIEISTALLRYAKDGFLTKSKTAEQILGNIDALKVRSCMTLFDLVQPNSIFSNVLDAFYNSERDPLTLEILKRQAMK